MRKIIIFCFGVLLTTAAACLGQQGLEECTVGVASGKASADGRPLLWKNRDSSARDNEVVYFKDGRFKYLALVSAGFSDSAWAGVNEFGFCIMNSVSSDLPGKNKKGLHNGTMMKLALQQCVTADDFENLLKQTNVSGRTTKANFGVIDAFGGAAFFETANFSYTRFDATDPKVAPDGFIVRANFAFTGGGDTGKVRYNRGNQLWQNAVDNNQLDYQYVLRTVARDMADANSVPYPIKPAGVINENPGALLNTQNAISRYNTVSVALFHGVKPDENPSLTTFWAILGEPTFSVAVPCWVVAESVAPELDGPKVSPICSAARELHRANYLIINNKKRFMKPDRLDDIRALTYPAEDRIFDQTDKMMIQWRRDYPTAQEAAQFHQILARRAYRALLRTREKLQPIIRH
ncbi:peptidase C45 [Planctomycetota bacterium]